MFFRNSENGRIVGEDRFEWVDCPGLLSIVTSSELDMVIRTRLEINLDGAWNLGTLPPLHGEV